MDLDSPSPGTWYAAVRVRHGNRSSAWVRSAAVTVLAPQTQTIYRASGGLAPANPISTDAQRQQTDYIPSGWQAQELGADSNNPAVWVSTRSSAGTVWTEWSQPVLHDVWVNPVNFRLDCAAGYIPHIQLTLEEESFVAPAGGYVIQGWTNDGAGNMGGSRSRFACRADGLPAGHSGDITMANGSPRITHLLPGVTAVIGQPYVDSNAHRDKKFPVTWTIAAGTELAIGVHLLGIAEISGRPAGTTIANHTDTAPMHLEIREALEEELDDPDPPEEQEEFDWEELGA